MSVIPFSLFHYDVIVTSVSEIYCDSHGKLTKELTYEENLYSLAFYGVHVA